MVAENLLIDVISFFKKSLIILITILNMSREPFNNLVQINVAEISGEETVFYIYTAYIVHKTEELNTLLSVSLHPIQQINFDPLLRATWNEYGPLSFLLPLKFL